MSFIQRKAFSHCSRVAAQDELQPKPNLVPQRGAFASPASFSRPQHPTSAGIQTKANFDPIQHNPTHFITFITFHHISSLFAVPSSPQTTRIVRESCCSCPNQPRRQNSKPKPISTPFNKILHIAPCHPFNGKLPAANPSRTRGRVRLSPPHHPEIDAHRVIRSVVRMSASWFLIAAALGASSTGRAVLQAVRRRLR